MLRKLFGENSATRKTGTYKVIGNVLEEYETLPDGGSMNAISMDLGYHPDQVHIAITFDSKITSNIGVKIFTKEPVFVMTEDKIKSINLSTVQTELNKIDWSFEYSSSNIESILEQGIENKSLTLDYLKSVTTLTSKGDDIYFAKEIDLLLQFENEILVTFGSTDGLNAASKWLKSINFEIFESMLTEAQSFHESLDEAIEEINCQCSALHAIPDAMENEFIDSHINTFGNINFYNLYAAHYASDSEISKNEFLLVNNGRILLLTDFKFVVDGFTYQFDENDFLENVINDGV
ncbi:MAG: hypothetical protein KOO66_10990 [Bacteroidales bacterium]|nr:hypothetical protein [Bacteroidales bacterium]